MHTESITKRRHVLSKNPNFRGEPYPCEGEPGDEQAGLLADCGELMPFIDRIVFQLEKESVPLLGKFLQGYYDIPQIERGDRKSTRLNSSHVAISYAVFCLKKKKKNYTHKCS